MTSTASLLDNALRVSLSGTASQHERAAAESWLFSAASSSPGAFCDALLSLIAATSHSADPQQVGARFLAATQLKNVVGKRWRELSGEDKERIRPLLLSWLLSEPHQAVALSSASVSVAKVARHDWPSLWPSLLPELLTAAAAATTTTSLRARLGLATVLKELASKRLSSDVRAFRALASDNGESGLLSSLWKSFCDETRALVSSVSCSRSGGANETLFESWALVLKSLRVLLVSGFSETEAATSAAAAAAAAGNGRGGGGSGGGPCPVPAVAAALPTLVDACTALSSLSSPIGRRALLKLLKALRMTSEAHPWSLVASGAVPAASRVAAVLISSDARTDEVAEADGEEGEDDEEHEANDDKIVVQSCLLLKAALAAVQDAIPPLPPSSSFSSISATTATTTSSSSSHDRLSAARASVSSTLPLAREALSGPALSSIVDSLISNQMRLRPRSDLSKWKEDPESWALSAESGAAAWRESRRASAEALLSAAVAAERELLAPRLALALRETCARFDEALARAASAAGASPSSAEASSLTSAALDKEAAAAAATVASYELHDHVPFSQWLSADLLPDLVEAAAGTATADDNAAAANTRRRLLSTLPPSKVLPAAVSRALARRAALAIASWVPKATREDRMRCYPPLISLLGGGSGDGSSDAAVALAAASALRALVDDWDFVEEDFAPLSGSAFAAAARALGGGVGRDAASSSSSLPLLRDQESHVSAFGLVGVIVDRLPPGSVASHAPSLMQFLPAVWSSSSPPPSSSSTGSEANGNNNSGSMLRVQCISLLSRLLLSLGDESPAAYPALLPMLSECLSSSPGLVGGGRDDLVEDGLGLWLVALRTAPAAAAWGSTAAISKPLVSAGCSAAASALERTSATALAPLAAAGAGSAALLSCCGGKSDAASSSPASSSAAAAAVEFATMPEARLLCDRLSLAAGETSERASMALVASADLILASATSSCSCYPPASPSSSPEPSSPPPSAAAAAAGLSLLQGMLVRLTASVLAGKEGPAVAGGVAALVARVVVAGEESRSGGGGGGAALVSLATAAAAASAASKAPVPSQPSLFLVDLMLERFASLPSGARKAVALALAALLGSEDALPTEALFTSVAEGNPAVAPWQSTRYGSPAPAPSRLLFPSIAQVLVTAFDEFEGGGGGGDNSSNSVVANGVQHHEADNDEDEPLPLRFLFDSSMAEAAAVGGSGGDCSALSESVDAEGEAQRRAALRKRGPVAVGKVSKAIAAGAAAAASLRRVEAWGAALQSLQALDPRLAGALRAAAERGFATVIPTRALSQRPCGAAGGLAVAAVEASSGRRQRSTPRRHRHVHHFRSPPSVPLRSLPTPFSPLPARSPDASGLGTISVPSSSRREIYRIVPQAERDEGRSTMPPVKDDDIVVAEGALLPPPPPPDLLPRSLERLRVEGGEESEQSPPSYLRVLSWNSLADGLAQHGRFSRCPADALSWERRRELIACEIERSSADVVCLQEVNRFSELEERLSRSGYEGVFWAKPVSPASRLGFPGDGSAVFWKRERFEMVSSVGRAFEATANVSEGSSASSAASSSSSQRRGVQGMLLVTLREKEEETEEKEAAAATAAAANDENPPAAAVVVVACVHLKAKEGAANDAARAAQAREAVLALEEQVVASSGREGGGEAVAVLAGDFNAEPGSAPHEVARGTRGGGRGGNGNGEAAEKRRRLQLRCLWDCEVEDEKKSTSGGNGSSNGAATTPGGNGASKAPPSSSSSPASTRPPPFTTYKFRSEDSESEPEDRGGRGKGDNGFVDVLQRRVSDFIFYSPRSADAVARWAPLDFDSAGLRETGIPGERYPSDHASVLAVLRLKGRRRGIPLVKKKKREEREEMEEMKAESSCFSSDSNSSNRTL